MNLTEEEFLKVQTAIRPVWYEDAVAEIKKVRGGKYPPDWYKKVVLSGVLDLLVECWREADLDVGVSDV